MEKDKRESPPSASKKQELPDPFWGRFAIAVSIGFLLVVLALYTKPGRFFLVIVMISVLSICTAFFYAWKASKFDLVVGIILGLSLLIVGFLLLLAITCSGYM